MPRVDLKNVSKVFPGPTVALQGLNLTAGEHELLVLLGPSGCGKTTTLRLIAGLEVPSAGEICFGTKRVNDTPSKDRDVAMVFQSAALYPHLSVYGNLAFGLRLRRRPGWFRWLARGTERAEKKEEERNVRQAAELLGMEKLLERMPAELSGGEQQRVALGGSIVSRPVVWLLDEPLSQLDARLRAQLRGEIKQLHKRLDTTTIYVTHDQAEAMALGDRVAVMREGKIEQIGPPMEVYRRPCNKFVAEFLGGAPINWIEGELKQAGETTVFEAHGWKLPLESAAPATERKGPVTLGVRPEDLRISPRDSGGEVALAAKVVDVEPLGDATVVYAEWAEPGPAAGRLAVRHSSTGEPAVGEEICVVFDPDRAMWFDPTSGDNLGLPQTPEG